MNILKRLLHFVRPTHCWKHKTKLKTYGWYEDKWCEECWDKEKRYTYK